LPNVFFFIFDIKVISQGFAGLVISTSTSNPVFYKGMVKKYHRYNSGRGWQQEKLHKSLQNVLSLFRSAQDFRAIWFELPALPIAALFYD